MPDSFELGPGAFDSDAVDDVVARDATAATRFCLPARFAFRVREGRTFFTGLGARSS
jgi:hypothetical protein